MPGSKGIIEISLVLNNGYLLAGNGPRTMRWSGNCDGGCVFVDVPYDAMGGPVSGYRCRILMEPVRPQASDVQPGQT